MPSDRAPLELMTTAAPLDGSDPSGAMDGISQKSDVRAGADDPGDGGVRVLYIGGTGRMGSTLLCRIVGEQPDFHPLGEAIDIWQLGVIENRRCSCDSLFHDCAFWASVAEEAPGIFDESAARRFAELANLRFRARELPRLWTPAARNHVASRLPPEYLHAIARLYAAIKKVSGARVIVDGSKNPMYAFVLSAVDSIDVTTVQVVRDPRAVAFSLRRKLRDPDHPDAIYPRYRADVTAAVWMMSYISLDIIGRRSGTRRRPLRYEDFVSEPDEAIRWLVEQAGETYVEPSQRPEGETELSPVHMISGNPNRFVSGAVPIRLDDEWRTALPAGQRRLVTTMTLPLLARYGYLAKIEPRGRVSR